MLNKMQLAEAFNVSLVTVTNWVRRGCPYISKGGQGKSYRFDLDEVRGWKMRQENVPFQVDPPSGMTGNALRDFSMEAICHFFFCLFSDFLPSVSGMLKELKEENISDEANKKICVYIYLLAECYARQYLRKDEFNRYLKKCGSDIDDLWNCCCKPHMQRARTYPEKVTLQMPDNIEFLLQDKNLMAAAKAFCRGENDQQNGGKKE